MYRKSCPFTAVLLGSALCAFAQTPAVPQAPASIGSAIEAQVTLVEHEMIDAAQAMPAEKFDFTPESLDIKGSNYKGVYTFAGLIKHAAAVNFLLWSGAVGERPPANVKDIKGPAEIKSKADVVQFLKDSFALGHRAAKGLTAENSTDMIRGVRGMQPRIFVVTFMLTHCFDEYGQMVEYLRMNGVVPPASAGTP